MADINIRRVEKSYGDTRVVHGVDLDIRDGEFVVILGPSGCGKSTLLRMIAGLEAISGGEIAIGGRVVNDLEPRQRGCAMVFQNYALYPHMSVAENIGYALKIAGIGKAERRARVQSVATAIGLEDYLDRRPGQLSGGQRQRVAMGRAMIREPKVFLFDEPLSNLDAKLRVQMRLEIRHLHQRLAATSVFVTHDQIEAMTLADRMVVMNQGNIEQVGAPSDVYDRPASTFVASFIGSPPMNLLPGRMTESGQHVELADGQHVPIPTALAQGRAGRPVTLGIRPEDIRHGPAAGGSGLTAKFDFLEELGMGRLFHGTLGGQDIIMHATDKTPPVFGTAVDIAFDPSRLHLFDVETGKRLAGESGRADKEQWSGYRATA
ncbi:MULTISPECIES: sn-glycerol-3-phosphate import ATP-binding protein UgpC [Thalassobaculum]|uniref:sn-glycerol 3-phosphate transport system ATP-binding protein n=1 Tax=Thalassobaculum litoreum DSM 18839 TaxID=1123362 RepID=A0A8G2BMJ3_9PROT|nr:MULTISPECIES: sn-glycerol-3-phosphate import ATP-binding protein UgpC [Thalassobaculum]SDG55750.1 sn-glycerol 3-phosphate transport system ATP-binding protein [Thalassobaculum litoreum DSM 18839]